MKLVMKTITYRCYSILISFFTLYALTGKLKLTVEFTIIIEFVKFIQYYVFELFWKRKYLLKKALTKSERVQIVADRS